MPQSNTTSHEIDPMYRELPYILSEADAFVPGMHTIVEEAPLTLNVNGRHVLTAMVSPAEIEEFVIGYLYTEQIIKGINEIESIKRDNSVVSVLTTNLFKITGSKKLIVSGCGGTSNFLDIKKLPKIASDFTIPSPAISEGMKRLLVVDSELHRMTGGIHAVGLAGREGFILMAQDIGRHNALDKVIGKALKSRIDLSQTLVFTSGRISSEMVRKCLVANIPVIASRGATTSLAVDTAAQTGLCVIGFVRAGKKNIYTHPERVEGASPSH